jgi:hypothetical protein
MIDTQMQMRYQVSHHMANGVRRYGVTFVDDAFPQMCNSLNFLHVYQCLQVTPQIKIQLGEIEVPGQQLHRPSTSYPVTRKLPVQPLFYAGTAMVLDLWDTPYMPNL